MVDTHTFIIKPVCSNIIKIHEISKPIDLIISGDIEMRTHKVLMR